MNCKCDKCGADVCAHCGKVCNETCDKARIERLEREIEELKARPATIQFVPIPHPYPVIAPPPPVYYPPWRRGQPTITCETNSLLPTPNTNTITYISQ